MVSEELRIVVRAEADQAIRNLKKTQDAAGGTEKKFLSLAQSLIGPIGVAVALRGAVKAMGTMITASNEQAIATAKLEAALRATNYAVGLGRSELDQYAREMSRLIGVSDEVVTEAQAILLTFTQISGEVFPDAMKAAADMSALFGGNLQQSIIQLGKALNDPVLGVGALKESGVSFSEGQREMIKSMVEANDVMGAQREILAELNREFGGTAEAIGAVDSVGRFKTAWSELAEIGGRAINTWLSPTLDLLTKVANKIVDTTVSAQSLNDQLAAMRGDPNAAIKRLLREEYEKARKDTTPAGRARLDQIVELGAQYGLNFEGRARYSFSNAASNLTAIRLFPTANEWFMPGAAMNSPGYGTPLPGRLASAVFDQSRSAAADLIPNVMAPPTHPIEKTPEQIWSGGQADAIEQMSKTMQNSLVPAAQAFGQAWAQSGSAIEGAGAALQSVSQTILNMLPQIFLQLALSAPTPGMKAALIGAAITSGIIGGAMGSSRSSMSGGAGSVGSKSVTVNVGGSLVTDDQLTARIEEAVRGL